MKTTTETTFETVVTDGLLSTGYKLIPAERFDRDRAMFFHLALEFIQETQPQHWMKLKSLHGIKTEERVLHDLCTWLDSYGSLATLRHGFKCYGKILRIAIFKAAHDLNTNLEAHYAANVVGVTRQLHYSPKHESSFGRDSHRQWNPRRHIGT